MVKLKMAKMVVILFATANDKMMLITMITRIKHSGCELRR